MEEKGLFEVRWGGTKRGGGGFFLDHLEKGCGVREEEVA